MEELHFDHINNLVYIHESSTIQRLDYKWKNVEFLSNKTRNLIEIKLEDGGSSKNENSYETFRILCKDNCRILGWFEIGGG